MRIRVNEAIFRKDLYPRIKADASIIQKYAENLEVLPPIEINQNKIMIDGFHRWTAHRKAEAEFIEVEITQTKSEAELYALSIQRNATHGLQLNDSDKKDAAITLYNAGKGLDKDKIAETLSVSKRTINNYLTDIDKDLREKRKQKIFDMYLACYTQEEIAEDLEVDQKTVGNEIEVIGKMETLPKFLKVNAAFNDDFDTPLYNVWTFAKKTNSVSHFGNSEQRILENLIYLYTQPFDIVVDPFAGGGSTIDVCKKRLRRYYVSDRKPIVERENEIRLLDICQNLPPLHKRWSEVTLTYLDPPYWKQSEGKYSTDSEDLANMSLGDFTQNLTNVINSLAKKQSKGTIALLIQPTQWKADDKEFTDHVTDLVKNINLPLENRISCPYSTQQCTPQQVDWAKENKKLLVISRELIVWRLK